MVTNKELSAIYLNSNQDKEQISAKIFEIVNTNGCGSEVKSQVDSWVKQFQLRWARTRSRARLWARESDWLASEFKPSASSPKSDSRKQNLRSGRKIKPFEKLAPTTKNKLSRVLSNKEVLDKLLRAAEKSARKKKCTATAKIIKKLRENGETWAKSVSRKLACKQKSPSTEEALQLKTRAGLLKAKYRRLSSFAKRFGSAQLFPPWEKLMELRNQIIPTVPTPVWEDGILTLDVGVRELTTNTAERILGLDHVQETVSTLVAGDEPVECTFYVSAGIDSATGYSQYNQGNLLNKDDSLLVESFMPLALVTENGCVLWVNPSPQSDLFCRTQSLRWAKEKDQLTRKLFAEFYEAIADIEKVPIELKTQHVILLIRVEASYSLVDGKVANAIINNRYTKSCPLCHLSADPRVGPHFFHSRLNIVEWVIRVSAQKQVPGSLPQSDPLVQAAARQIADELESEFKIRINRAKSGGCGSSNNGNMARILLSDPIKFARILGISEALVENIRMISSLALSSKFLNGNKVEKLYDEMEQQIMTEFPLVTLLPPCVHKYKHLAELAEKQRFPMSFSDEQPGERTHKRFKGGRTYHAQKDSSENNMIDMIRLSLTWSDPQMSDKELRSKRLTPKKYKDQEFSKKMAFYFKGKPADDGDYSDASESEDDEE